MDRVTAAAIAMIEWDLGREEGERPIDYRGTTKLATRALDDAVIAVSVSMRGTITARLYDHATHSPHLPPPLDPA